MQRTEWILCPIRGGKAHAKIREDAEMKNFSLHCPKRKQKQR